MDFVKPTLLIPVEIQARELEGKVLLACVAAKRGFPSVIGPRREMHSHILSFPKSIYLSKSTTKASCKVFRHMEQLGNKIVVWDEEALVALPPELYYRHRLFPKALDYVSHLLAWGEENAKLWHQYPDLPAGIPIHITGNPRGDMLRPELRGYYQDVTDAIHKTYGDYILINTNFNLINAYSPDMNLLLPDSDSGEELILSRRSKSLGLSLEYAKGFTTYKRTILKDFERLIPELDEAFPNYAIVVRPHPAENKDTYNRVAEKCKRVHVCNEGNVVPWLMGAKAMIHNGCTTGVEAYAMGVPAIAYRASVNEYYDNKFHRLPNLLSHQCFNFDELLATLTKILAGQLDVINTDECKVLMERHLSAMDGRLACERIVDVLETVIPEMSKMTESASGDRLRSWFWVNKRRLKKRLRGYRSNMSHNRSEFLRYRYPKISLGEMRNRVSRFHQLIGNSRQLIVKQLVGQFFRISS